MRDSGMIVTTKSGKKGRTYNSKGLINGKVPVYLESDRKFIFSNDAVLCSPETLTSTLPTGPFFFSRAKSLPVHKDVSGNAQRHPQTKSNNV